MIIDRFEGDFAIIEINTGKFVDMPRILLPKEASEGDVIEIRIDKNQTEARKKKIRGMMDRLFED